MTVENYEKHEAVNQPLEKALQHLSKAGSALKKLGTAHKANIMELATLRLQIKKIQQQYDFKTLDQ
jgi:hypothetical protein